MDRRHFFRVTAAAGAGVLVSGTASCATSASSGPVTQTAGTATIQSNLSAPAAKAAIDYFDIKGEGYELFYSPHLTDASGQVNPFGQVELGPWAFESWSELGLTLGHEIEVHWEAQFKMFGPVSSNQEWFMREYQADQYEIRNAQRFQLTPRQLENTNHYLNKHFNALTKGNKDLVRIGIYEEPGN